MLKLTKIFGTKNERELKKISPMVDEINEHYERLKHLTDDDLRGKTDEFKKRIAERTRPLRDQIAKLDEEAKTAPPSELGNLRTERNQLLREQELAEEDVLSEILPEAYAVVKETCRRLVGKKWEVTGIESEWNMVPFDVQLIGAVVLHERPEGWRNRYSEDEDKREKAPRGKIAEMATGEGKTLVATMPIYLNALTGRGVHLVTVNDYLAKRDREWMGPIYEFLGLTVGVIQAGMEPEERKLQYNCDITYGTNNEFGFDYLRDNMTVRPEHRVQRGHHYAIVDEVDSVLIDEARTPLIISGPVEHSLHQFDKLKPVVERVVHNQTLLVNRMVAEAEKLIKEGREDEAGVKLLRARRGAPKNNRLLKLEKEKGIKKLIESVEIDYMRDKKLGQLDEELFFSIDEKSNVVDISEKGRDALSPKDLTFFVLPDLATELHRIDSESALSPREKMVRKDALQREHAEKSEKIHNVNQLLRAYSLFEKDVEYVVADGKVMIVDEFTGRLMPGRRYSDGLHQAIEAKEGVVIEKETQTLATITLQNYFKMYEKLAGMTGTAETEAHEFWEIYRLDVMVIPTNEPVRRINYDDVIYKTRREKYNAVIDEIVKMHEAGRPVLVGTVSVEVSETLSRMLKRKKIPHQVLNAKYHQQEAQIIAKAGEAGKVTIATNMAGRGTDIKLGPGVVRCEKCCLMCKDEDCENCDHERRMEECTEEVPCGLHILGTERHDARRIDRQLRGRCARQGDPGSSRFYLSLEDDLMRLFGSDRIAGVMDRFGVDDGEAIHHPLVTKAIGNAQQRVERYHFDIRKRLLEYDDVMNVQRKTIYELRDEALDGADLQGRIVDMFEEIVNGLIATHTDPREGPETWNWDGLREDLLRTFMIDLQVSPKDVEEIKVDDLREKLLGLARLNYQKKEELVGPEEMRRIERLLMLQVIDSKWRDHLYELDALKEGIGLRSYAQKDPLVEYKHESYRMFEELIGSTAQEAVTYLFRLRFRVPEEEGRAPVRAYKPTLQAPVPEPVAAPTGPPGAEAPGPQPAERRVVTGTTYKREARKVGRNEPCPCGSGKKYKHCCGRGG